MQTVVQLRKGETPCTIGEVVAALRAEKLEPRHEKKSWGDWIYLVGCETVISIESMRGLTGSATIEHSEEEPEDLAGMLFRAFHRLGWVGVDEEGEYPLR